MKHNKHLLGALCMLAGLGLAACDDTTPPPTNTTNDAATDTAADVTPADVTPADVTPADVAPADVTPADVTPADVTPADVTPADVPATDGSTGTPLCNTYCTQMTTVCVGANAQYNDMADCMAYCSAARWPAGDPGAMAGDNLNCRVYHVGAAAMSAPAFHCPHAGPNGGGVCGTLPFRTEAPAMYRRVDRMGMPAVSTALLPSARKNAFNDVAGRTDMGMFVTDIVTTLTGLHTALDRHLIAAGLTPCSMTTLVGTLPECLGQPYAPGATVASLVVPDDAIVVTPASPAGFPNGRRLEDPVIDVTLSVLLLRLGSTCAGGTCSALTLASPGAGGRLPLNPARNDVPLLTDFPYLAPAQPPR
jgi:hypothetical protein